MHLIIIKSIIIIESIIVGQLQSLVKALKGKWQTTVNVMQNFVD